MVVIFSKLRKKPTVAAPEVVAPTPYRACCSPESHRLRREAELSLDFPVRRPRPILMRSTTTNSADPTTTTPTMSDSAKETPTGARGGGGNRLASCEQFTTKATFFFLGSFFALSVYLLVASFQHVCNWPTVKTAKAKGEEGNIVRNRREGVEETIAMVDLGAVAADYEGSVEGSGVKEDAAGALAEGSGGDSASSGRWPSENDEDPMCSYCRDYCYKIDPRKSTAASSLNGDGGEAALAVAAAEDGGPVDLKLPKLAITENESNQFPTINNAPDKLEDNSLRSASSSSTLDFEFVDGIFNDFTSDGSALILENNLGGSGDKYARRRQQCPPKNTNFILLSFRMDKAIFDFILSSFFKKFKITLSLLAAEDQSTNDNDGPCFTLRLFENYAYEIDDVNTRLAVMWIEDDNRFKSWRVENWVHSQRMITLCPIRITGRPKYSPRYDLEWELEFLRDF
ncbi:Oidioi.mRNA.OKI2018_I69.chr1.g2857.t1.cds [Oikopleura dioica]|uniref:Oidioi.mRNA.OKI2018_I69.chr1.g2857.t1.cds n=1 Tax=Oikopleura dioica TaxID=34765 RepID=A0ABN7SWP9_OIKDI|nr:Oidioi.mRNA.OKI2018_I69.chr1.g2857.t1.cds [Oikopleura dioica]